MNGCGVEVLPAWEGETEVCVFLSLRQGVFSTAAATFNNGRRQTAAALTSLLTSDQSQSHRGGGRLHGDGMPLRCHSRGNVGNPLERTYEGATLRPGQPATGGTVKT